MARRIAIPSKDAQLKIVGPVNALTVPRVQRLSVTADRPSTDIDELGNRLHAGTVEDIPAITTTFQAMDVGLKLFSVLTGKDWDNYPASGVSITDMAEVDIVVQIKNDTVEDYVKMAEEFFGLNIVSQINLWKKEVERDKAIAEKFNGHKIMEEIPNLKGKELGNAITNFKRYMSEELQKDDPNADSYQLLRMWLQVCSSEYIMKEFKRFYYGND